MGATGIDLGWLRREAKQHFCSILILWVGKWHDRDRKGTDLGSMIHDKLLLGADGSLIGNPHANVLATILTLTLPWAFHPKGGSWPRWRLPMTAEYFKDSSC